MFSDTEKSDQIYFRNNYAEIHFIKEAKLQLEAMYGRGNVVSEVR
jgi:hypothetical protein